MRQETGVMGKKELGLPNKQDLNYNHILLLCTLSEYESEIQIGCK